MRKILLGIVALFALTSCSTISEIYTDIPKQVAIAQTTLTAAEKIAVAYSALQPCGVPGAHLCRNPTVEQQIAQYDNDAFAAIELAYKVQDETALEAAQTALAKLTSITDNVTVQ